jgi:zinc transporter ZupT
VPKANIEVKSTRLTTAQSSSARWGDDGRLGCQAILRDATTVCLEGSDEAVLAALLALSAGALIYVGASHLLPTAEREPRRYNLLALGAGIFVAFGIIATHG